MSENLSYFTNELYSDESPKIKLTIRVDEIFEKDYREKRYNLLSKNERIFASEIKEGDSITIYYPTFFVRRTKTSIESFMVSIKNNRTLELEDFKSSNIQSLWRLYIKKFTIIND